MSFMNAMLGPVPRVKNQQPVIVGLPFEDSTFYVHPDDNTPEWGRVYLYYDNFDKANYYIDAEYAKQNELFERRLKGMSACILYRAVYENGKEFIIPVADYDDGFRESLLKMIAESRAGNWILRTPYHSQKKSFSYCVSHNTYLQPAWSGLSFDGLLKKAFINHKITNNNHIVAGSFEFVSEKKMP